MTYIDGALVAGWAAHVMDRIIARHMGALLTDARLSPAQRAELESVKADIRKAARRWEASTISDDSSYETPPPETASSSDQINAEQAAQLLGVGLRRAQQLAAGGLGVKVRGAWLLDRKAVVEHRQGRRTGEGERAEGRGPQAVRDVA